MKKSFFVDNNFLNSRLDKWFRHNVCELPQSLIEKNLRKGNIKVNNKKKKSSYRLIKNDYITIHNFNFKKQENVKLKNIYIPTKKELSSTSKMIIDNNENFVVINKPAGISVQSGTKSRRNILDILRETSEFKKYYPYTVHRIDKDTTGLLIVAKNRKYAQLFTSLFRIRKIHKMYLGIVLGELPKNKGTFIDELVYLEGKKQIKVKAITHFTVIDSSKNYSLLKLIPETGRKHQLRKQLLLRGYPILGDSKYRFPNKNPSKKNRLMLHAYKIKFLIDGVKYNYSAEIPSLFKSVLKEKYLEISEL